MKRCAIAVCLMLVITACGREEHAAPETTTAPANPTESGEIRLPHDSPQLSRLRIEEVQTEQVPL